MKKKLKKAKLNKKLPIQIIAYELIFFKLKHYSINFQEDL